MEMMDWERVYEEYADDVHRFLLLLLRHEADADDVRQETFIRAFTHWETFRHSSGVRTWLLSIARNLALDRLRKNKRRELLHRLLRRQPEPAAPTPEMLFATDERRKMLHRLMQDLPDAYRLVLILRGLKELTTAEAAEILDWPPQKVHLTYHRAQQALRKKAEKEEMANGYVSTGSPS